MISESQFQEFLTNARKVTVYVSDGDTYVIIKNFTRNSDRGLWMHGSILTKKGVDVSRDGEKTSVKKIYDYVKGVSKPYYTVTVFANKRKLTIAY